MRVHWLIRWRTFIWEQVLCIQVNGTDTDENSAA